MNDLTTKLAEALLEVMADADGYEKRTGMALVGGWPAKAREALRLYDAAKAQPKQAAEPDALYWRLHSLSTSLEARDVIDGMENKDAYPTILDAMAFVRVAPVAQAEPWQPIETAPTDHFPRLLRVRGLTMQGFRDVAGHWNVQTETSPHWRKLRGKPTHWMPLPQPPKEQP